MRVLMLSWEYPPNVVGGMGRHVAELTPPLVRAGVEVHVVTPQTYPSPTKPDTLAGASTETGSPGWEVTEAGVVVHRAPLAESSCGIYEQAHKTNEAMQAQTHSLVESGYDFDLIHAHDWLVVFAAYALKHELRRPLIATIHATEQGRAHGGTLYTELQRNIHGAEQWLTYEAWRVIACSHAMASEVQGLFHVPPEKIDVVPNGVYPYQNGQCNGESLAAYQARYGMSDGPVVFTIGRLVHEKGFHRLIEAIPRILSEFPNAHFIIAGRGPEAPYLEQQARALGVADRVFFPGFISDQERNYLYQAAACAAFPSVYEPFGIVALEAMAAGCPVVVTETGGFREVVRHDKTGVTVYPDDASSLAWGVLHTLRNPALAAARAEEARQVVRREFNWDTIASRTIAVYRRVLDERQRVNW